MLRCALALALTAMTLTGCGQHDQISAVTIVGGRAVAPSALVARHTVAIVAPDSGRPYCTGTLLEKGYVLTAAHCFMNAPSASVTVAFGLGFLPSEEVVRLGGKRLDHPDFAIRATGMSTSDIALIKITYPMYIPSTFTPAARKESWAARIPASASAARASAADISAGTEVVIAGYGIFGFRFFGTQPRLNDKDQLHEAKVLVDVIDADDQDAVIYRSPGDRSGSCHGDSGGPMFVSTGTPKTLKLIGVTRSGILGERGSLQCKGRGAYTNAAYFKAWLDSTLGS